MYLYVDEKKLSVQVTKHLGPVVVKPYSSVFQHVKELTQQHSTKILVDNKCSFALIHMIGTAYECNRSLIQSYKAIKNPVEQDGFRECHKRDATALVRYFQWLENELVNLKNKTLTEAAAADKLEAFRAELSGFKGLSFDTISSSGANGTNYGLIRCNHSLQTGTRFMCHNRCRSNVLV